MTFAQGKIGVMVDMEIGPGVIGWRAQGNVQPGRTVASTARFDGDGADGILFLGRPDVPRTAKAVHSLLEIDRWQHLLLGIQVPSVNIIQPNVARSVPEAKVHGRRRRRILARSELELDLSSGLI